MPALHLIERFESGVWRAVQATVRGSERASFWREPPNGFRDRLGQYCWRDKAGRVFCSDISGDLRHHGVVENEDAMRGLGFVKTGGEPINGTGAAEEPATPKT